MKNAISLACLLLLTATVFSQKNMVKGHIGGLPASRDVFSIGIGYERMLTEAWSAQLMYNIYGWSEGRLDGSSEVTKNGVLEVRRYLGPKYNEPRAKTFFVGSFVEAYRRNVLPGGETSEPPPPIIGKREGLGGGLVFGMHLPIFKKATLEVFAGPKLRYVNSVDYIGTASNYESYNSHNYLKLTPRIGCNIGYRF